MILPILIKLKDKFYTVKDGNCVQYLWFMGSEAQNSEIIYSSEKDAVNEEHTVWKIKQEGNNKNSMVSCFNFLSYTWQDIY